MPEQLSGSAPASEHPAPPGKIPPSVDMRFPIKSVLIFFASLIPVYLLVYAWIEKSRVQQGSWKLIFASEPDTRIPVLSIRHPGLRIHSAILRFPQERLLESAAPGAVEVDLDKPLRPLPFGRRISEDLMFLPGVETLDLFGHEVEIAPRVLVIDRKEVPWQESLRIDVHPDTKLSPESARRPKKRP